MFVELLYYMAVTLSVSRSGRYCFVVF